MPNCGRIGWSDFVFFFNFKMYIVLLIRSSIPKISNFGHACITHASILSFSKNHRALILYFFVCGKFAETFLYIKEQLSEIKFKMKFLKYFFCTYFPKMHKTVFDLYKGKKIFVLVSFQFGF